MFVVPWFSTPGARDGFHRAHAALPNVASWHNSSRLEHAIVNSALEGPQLRVFLGASDGWSRALQAGGLNMVTEAYSTRLEAAGYEQELQHLLGHSGQLPGSRTM